MFPYTAKDNESEYDIQNNNLLYNINQKCQDIFETPLFFSKMSKTTRKVKHSNLYIIIYIYKNKNRIVHILQIMYFLYFCISCIYIYIIYVQSYILSFSSKKKKNVSIFEMFRPEGSTNPIKDLSMLISAMFATCLVLRLVISCIAMVVLRDMFVCLPYLVRHYDSTTVRVYIIYIYKYKI